MWLLRRQREVVSAGEPEYCETSIRNEKVKLRLIKQLTRIVPIAALDEYHYSPL